VKRDERYLRAKERVIAKRGFYRHLSVYVGVMVLLAVVDLTMGGAVWFHWPLLGWGVGVFFHALNTFSEGSSPISEEAIEREMDRSYEESLR